MNHMVKVLFLSIICLAGIIGTAYSKGVIIPPSISHIADQVTQKDQTKGPIAFTVADVNINLDSLIITGASGNTSLVADTNIVFGGSGSDRTVTITPNSNSVGTTQIYITVFDGVASTTDTFNLKVNSPPRLDTNTPLVVNEGGSGTITNAILIAVDTDNPPSGLIFTLGPDTSGVLPSHGAVKLNGVPLALGGKFTQDDVDNNHVSYTHDGSESASDFFTFTLTDADSGIASDNGFTVFHFNVTVTPVNDPPVAYDSTYFIGLGQTLNAQLKGTDPDSPKLHYRITMNGWNGTATIIDSTTGSFTYLPNKGFSGADSFYYDVNDGFLNALTPGKITVHITEQAPTAFEDSATTFEGVAFSDTLHATDPDLPPQVLKFSIISNGSKGTAVITDSAAGTFTYTPLPNMFGIDYLTFKANDGTYDSPPALFTITIRAKLQTGDIIVADNKSGIVLIDPSTGNQFVLASGDSLQHPTDVVIEQSGNLVVLDGQTGLTRVDPTTGHQTPLTPRSSFTAGPLGPTGLALEHDGNILVADGTAGIKRVDPSNGLVSVVSSGNNLGLAVSVAIAKNGDIFAGDASIFGGGQSKVVKVDPVTGTQSLISSGGNFKIPVGITVDDSDHIYVSDAASFAGGPKDLLIAVDSATGTQTVINTTDTLHIPTGLDFDQNGKLIVANNKSSSIFQVNPSTGKDVIISSHGYLQEPFGIAIVRPKPIFSASTAKIHFGGIHVGLSAMDSVMVTNIGDATLFITSVASDSSQFTVLPKSATISASSSQKFYVTFTPTSSDTILSQIMFTHNAYGTPGVVSVSGSGTLTGVKENTSGTPRQFALYHNYPNPFNPTTTVQFDIPRQSIVTVKIYSILGAEVATLINHKLYAPGSYHESFDATKLSSGVYFYEIVAEGKEQNTLSFRSVKKMVLAK